MIDENLYQLTKSVLYQLNTLKNSNETIQQSTMNMIDYGVAESELLLQCDYYLRNSEAEKANLHLQIKNLRRENLWLRDQLAFIQNKYHDCKQMNTTYSNEIQDLKHIEQTMSTTLENEFDFNLNIDNDDFNLIEEQSNLALVQFQQENYSEAEQIYEDILVSLCDNNYDESSIQQSSILTTLNNLSLIYRKQQRYQLADALENSLINLEN